MKTKTILGLLLAAITLSLTACSNDSADKGTSPQLSDVFISEITNIADEDLYWENFELHKTSKGFYYKRDEINNLPHYYKLCFISYDPDLDIKAIEFSYDNITYYTFFDECKIDYISSRNAYNIYFEESDVGHKIQYLRLRDSKNNISNVFEFPISVSIDPNYDYSAEPVTK
ncbi:MAG: hypothetical protein J6X84_09055 [Treponema sp.]|nr:hypothetical protein [Treponema sp.]